mmetsp:Transcript_76359/g.182844  ORF Transcript_76359/g.182844 Transcript_76359/m.182844 type:complete len:205 (-) Transcript_76359:1003-1617(-)
MISSKFAGCCTTSFQCSSRKSQQAASKLQRVGRRGLLMLASTGITVALLSVHSDRKTSQSRARRGNRKRSARVKTSMVNLASFKTSSSGIRVTFSGGDTGSNWSVWRKCNSASKASPFTSSPSSIGAPVKASRIPPTSMDLKYALLASRMRPSALKTRLSRPATNSTSTRAPLLAVQSTRRMSEQNVDSSASVVSAVKIRKGTV